MNGLEKWCKIEEGENLKNELYQSCTLCPRECHADRLSGKKGACGENSVLRVGRAALHMWEEPCISGTRGSGAVFFSGCSLRCIFCQNYEIAQGNCAREISGDRLSEIFLELQEKGAANINLVTATHFAPAVIGALKKAKAQGMYLPVIYNSSGYERVKTVQMLEEVVDVWLPDFKYMSAELAARYSHAPDYPEVAKTALAEMVRQVGGDQTTFDEDGIMKRGVIVRHLELPGCIEDSKAVIRYLYKTYGNNIYISIMNQYTPMEGIGKKFPELNRKLTEREYDELVDYAISIGVENGFIQEGETASESFIPPFTNEGV